MKVISFEHNDQIRKLIKYREKHFGKREQKAELLKRNESFLREFEGISKRLGKKFFSTGVFGLERIGEFYENNYEYEFDYPNVKIIETDIPVEEVYSLRVGLAAGFGKESELPPEWIQRDRFFKNAYNLDTVFIHGKDPNDINVKNNCKLEVLFGYIEKWIDFCHRWNINHEWRGELDSLHTSQPIRALIFQFFLEVHD